VLVQRVARPWPLHLDDLAARVGQQLASGGFWQQRGQFNDADAGQCNSLFCTDVSPRCPLSLSSQPSSIISGPAHAD
jgi:hypothetical protein